MAYLMVCLEGIEIYFKRVGSDVEYLQSLII
jgi:hypothetical protein